MSYLIMISISICSIINVNFAVQPDNEDVVSQGLYEKSDNVEILTLQNFDDKVYGKEYAHLLQFYNAYCGACRKYQPEISKLATEIQPWQNIIRLAVIDCSEEDNNDKCREFEVQEYPSLRYLHDHYVRGNKGDTVNKTENTKILKHYIIEKIKEEQKMGRMKKAPNLEISSFATYSEAVSGVPKDILYILLVFETSDSFTGSELALDLYDYKHIQIKRVLDTSELARYVGLKVSPAVVAITPTLAVNMIKVNDPPTKTNLLWGINKFLNSHHYIMPMRPINFYPIRKNHTNSTIKDDVIFYGDLEKTIRTTLHLEVVRHKILKDSSLEALLDYLDVLVKSYPFRSHRNLLIYFEKMRDLLRTKNEWSGDDVYNLVKKYENIYSPVYTKNISFIACQGSEPKYRGFSCGIWTLFHTLLENAATMSGAEGPKVLRAMYGYIINFFGCHKCSKHFKHMAETLKLWDVKENDEAILWLWKAHNTVNYRLHHYEPDEDPEHPKIQFPKASRCPRCRHINGTYNFPEVLKYMSTIYSKKSIKIKNISN